MKHYKGQILICSRKSERLIQGDEYIVIDYMYIHNIEYQHDHKDILSVKQKKTGIIKYLVDSRDFITLEVFREFKLRELGI